jgi:folate-binding protein YgfZ
LPSRFLLAFSPCLTASVTPRHDRYIIADDVQIVDVSPHYGLLSFQGPKAEQAAGAVGLPVALPAQPMTFASMSDATLGEIYVMNHPRIGSRGYDFFVPNASLGAVADRLVTAARELGGSLCGWQALETARIEAGIPRYGVDMDETNLPPETGLKSRAISYTKGCYIGQEIVARIRTYGQVSKALRGLRLPDDLATLPRKGDKLYQGTKSAGYITSSLASPTFQAQIALGYVRREMNRVGTELTLKTGTGEAPVQIVELPFQKDDFKLSYPARNQEAQSQDENCR